MIGPLPHGQAFLTVCDFISTPTTPGVVLLASNGSTAVAHSTSGIVNLGGSRRCKLITPPSIDDWYVPIWDDAGNVAPPDEQVWVSSILSDTLAAALRAGSGGLTAAPIVLPAGGLSPVVTQSFYIKRGDNEALIFQVTELDSSGIPRVVDVTGWTGNFKLRTQPDTAAVIINQPFYISDINGALTTDGTAGLIAYDWGRGVRTGETDRLGQFLAEFETHRPSGVKKTYPTTSDTSREYITVVFVADLDDAGSH